MDPIDKFLKLYSYKFPKGYPDMNDKQDILLLESILKEEFSIILEKATSATEDLHEVFVAMFLAGHKGFQDLNDFKEANWEQEIKKLKRLFRTEDHINTIKKYFTPENINNPNIISKYFDLYDDAEIGASTIKQYMGDIQGAQRVFDAGDSGKKVKADVIARDSDGSLNISLKYEKGQMNSLSASEVMNLLFDIKDVGKGEGFLGYLYGLEGGKYKESFDKGVREYISIILNNYNPNDPKFIKQSERKNKDYAKILDNFKQEGFNDITWKEYRTIGKDIQKGLSYAYTTLPPDKKVEYENSKKETINRSIEDYLKNQGKDQATDNQDDIRKLISIIIGPEENNSYLYAANLRKDGGKIFFMPSKKQIDSNEYVLSLQPKLSKKGEESANFEYIVTVKEKKSGLPLFQFDVLLRFGDGQWTSDVSQKGAYFKVFEENFGKIFPPV